MNEEPIQTNAADPEQVTYGRRKEKDLERAYGALWRMQLSTSHGREFVWTLLGGMKLFAWIASDDLQALGIRNKALEYWAQALRHPELFLQMQNEAIARDKREREGRRAARTPRIADTT